MEEGQVKNTFDANTPTTNVQVNMMPYDGDNGSMLILKNLDQNLYLDHKIHN